MKLWLQQASCAPWGPLSSVRLAAGDVLSPPVPPQQVERTQQNVPDLSKGEPAPQGGAGPAGGSGGSPSLHSPLAGVLWLSEQLETAALSWSRSASPLPGAGVSKHWT